MESYVQTDRFDQPSEGSLLAAIDIGSNSFHMVVARLIAGELKPIDIMSDKVQLAAGLDDSGILSAEAQQRGIDCLKRFAERLKELPRSSIRAVATNALREANNRTEFILQANAVLGLPMEVISGYEEARLIYLGVAHTLSDDTGRRLVIDIGGGSTECIIGERFESRLLESLQMGCVSYNEEFFPKGEITEKGFQKAKMAAMQELLSIRRNYRRMGWHSCVGSSGTAKAISQSCAELGFSNGSITADSLKQLKNVLLKFKHADEITLTSIKPERKAVLAAGTAIMCAIFESLDIEVMEYSDGALREGVLYDMAGRLRHEDVRERTIGALMKRYHVDAKHASNVETSALFLLAQVKDSWELNDDEFHDMLCWSARTLEIGLDISHNRYHRHSAYLLQNCDLPGFSNTEQLLLAFLARSHRRKIPKEELKLLPDNKQLPYIKLCIILRIAVILHRSRSKARTPHISFQVDGQKLSLSFPREWLNHHPLTLADLETEAEHLKSLDYKLKFN